MEGIPSAPQRFDRVWLACHGGESQRSLFGAFIYNSLGIPIAAGVLFPFFGILLNPIIAGGAMAMSSVTVVSNANRLRFFSAGGKQ